MIRFFFRALAFFSFAVAVMFVIIDATRSIGISELVFTTFSESFELIAPALLESLRNWMTQNAPAIVSGEVLATVLALPTFAVFAALAFLFYAIGRRPLPKSLKRVGR